MVARELPFAATYGTLFGGKYSTTSPTRLILIIFATFYLLYFPYRTSLSTTWLNTSFGLCIKSEGTFWLSQRSRTTPGIWGVTGANRAWSFLMVAFCHLDDNCAMKKDLSRALYYPQYMWG